MAILLKNPTNKPAAEPLYWHPKLAVTVMDLITGRSVESTAGALFRVLLFSEQAQAGISGLAIGDPVEFGELLSAEELAEVGRYCIGPFVQCKDFTSWLWVAALQSCLRIQTREKRKLGGG